MSFSHCRFGVLFAHKCAPNRSHTQPERVSSVNANRKTVIKLSIKRTSFIELSHLQRTKCHGNYRCFTIKIDVIDTPLEYERMNVNDAARTFRYAVHHSFNWISFAWSNIYRLSVLFFHVGVRHFALEMFNKTLPSIHICPHIFAQTHTHTPSVFVSAAGCFGKSEIHLVREYLNSTYTHTDREGGRTRKKDHAICPLFIHYWCTMREREWRSGRNSSTRHFLGLKYCLPLQILIYVSQRIWIVKIYRFWSVFEIATSDCCNGNACIVWDRHSDNHLYSNTNEPRHYFALLINRISNAQSIC